VSSTLITTAPGATYEPVRGVFAGVRPACPLCPWRGRTLAAGTAGWVAWIRLDLANHNRTAHEQEKPS